MRKMAALLMGKPVKPASGKDVQKGITDPGAGTVRQLMYGGDIARVGTDLGILSLWLLGGRC